MYFTTSLFIHLCFTSDIVKSELRHLYIFIYPPRDKHFLYDLQRLHLFCSHHSWLLIFFCPLFWGSHLSIHPTQSVKDPLLSSLCGMTLNNASPLFSCVRRRMIRSHAVFACVQEKNKRKRLIQMCSAVTMFYNKSEGLKRVLTVPFHHWVLNGWEWMEMSINHTLLLHQSQQLYMSIKMDYHIWQQTHSLCMFSTNQCHITVKEQ